MKKFVKFIFKLLLILIIAFIGIFFGKGYWGYLELTQSQSVDDVVSEVTSRSTFVGYDDLSPELVRATVAIEDRRFYVHGGVDYIGLMRALVSQFDDDLLKSGGSTITQQLAKNLYGMFDGTWDRKSTELFVARYLEKHYSKNEIIALYVNVINYGNNYTGIYEAIEKAVVAIDNCVKDTVEAAKANGYEVIIIADHGNADHALNADGTPNTAHSLNPVPFVYVTENKDAKVENGVLADVAPSILHILGMAQPADMTGHDLIRN